MRHFTTKDFECFSGIKAHTLRTWESRYNILQPRRNVENFRLYNTDDLKTVLNISLLTRNGYRISQLCVMTTLEMESKIEHLTMDEDKQEKIINELILSMYTLNIHHFEHTLSYAYNNLPLDIFSNKIIFIFLHRTGLFWQGNKLTEEHFVVTAIRQKLMNCIEKTSKIENKKKKVLLFLSKGKQLDLALLYTNFFLKLNGFDVLYMGNDVSLNNLKEVFSVLQPDFIFTYAGTKNKYFINELSAYIKNASPYSKFIITIYSAKQSITIKRDESYSMSYQDALNYILDK